MLLNSWKFIKRCKRKSFEKLQKINFTTGGIKLPWGFAARIMQREFTAVPSNWTVGQTIDYLREEKDLPEEFLEIFM